ncbi:MAG: LptA/OstA family protein [Planctomycetota bacterium]
MIALLIASLLVVSLGASQAGESTREEFQGLRLPVYREGELTYELRSKTGSKNDQSGLAKLFGVTILAYDSTQTADTPEGAADLVNTPPPLKYRITSERGTYNNGTATLSGNVLVESFGSGKDKSGSPVRVPEATIRCNSATWSHANQTLSCQGRIRMTRGGDILEGTDLFYQIVKAGAAESSEIKILRDVTMTIHSMDEQPEDPNAAGTANKQAQREPTIVSCAGVALYQETNGTIFFNREVEVHRPSDGVKMFSNKLKVTMETDAQNKTRVSQLHATQQVRIIGFPKGAKASSQAATYQAKGSDAVYSSKDGLLILKGSAEAKPVVTYGQDLIQDDHIIFKLSTGVLTAEGSKESFGIAELQGTQRAPKGTAPIVTHIRYRDQLIYNRTGGVATFKGQVNLKRGAFQLDCDSLEVKTPSKLLKGEKEKIDVRRVTARGSVRIRTEDGRRATAEEAVFDTVGNVLQLSGPPAPIVEQPDRSRVRADRIFSFRVPVPGKPNRFTNRVKGDGKGQAVFFGNTVADPDNPDAPSDSTRIVYTKGMDYDEAKRTAQFNGNVVLTRGDLVLRAGRLEVELEPRQEGPKTSPTEAGKLTIARLVARGGVEMHMGGRHTSSDRLIYDVKKKLMTLLSDGVEKAKVWENRGSSLAAQRIVDYQTTHTIEADGPGVLNMVEPDPHGGVGKTARISFEGRCVYEAKPKKPATAVFHRRVVLRWQDMTVYGNRLDTELEHAPNISATLKTNQKVGDSSDPGNLLQHGLKLATMSGDVRIESPERSAKAEKAIVDKQNNSISLSGPKGAQLLDERGIRLRSKSFVLYRRDETVKALGPGTLFISAGATDRLKSAIPGMETDSKPREAVLPGKHPMDYILNFKGEMVYSLFKRRIVFYQEVELQQAALYARCDQMEALLISDKGSRHGSAGTEGVTLTSAEMIGNVFIRRYEPPKGAETLEEVLQAGSSTTRPGTTVLVDCDHAMYDVPRNRLIFSSKERGVRILEQIVRRGRAQRRYYHDMDKAIFDRNRGEIRFPFGLRRPKIQMLPIEGPLRFEN